MTGFEEKLNGIVRRRKQEKAEWKASCPSVEELLCLQLSGYSSRQIVGMGIEGGERAIERDGGKGSA